jgi:hypothetical protein
MVEQVRIEQKSSRVRKYHDTTNRILRPRTFTCGLLISSSPDHPLPFVCRFLLWEQHVGGSNPPAPTSITECPVPMWHGAFFFSDNVLQYRRRFKLLGGSSKGAELRMSAELPAAGTARWANE